MRIRHMVIFDLRYTKESPEALQFLQDATELLTQIETVQGFEAMNQISPKNDYQYGFSMEFENEEAYRYYNEHPIHVSFVEERWKNEVSRFLEIDFELK
ncbi:MAG: Dabb family protein [Vallitaleaceae bacterium]|nr:Dabb family protein [Vallitaleaceae bacterium]